MRRLPASSYLRFPFNIGKAGAATSNRRDHVREQIAQVIHTAPGERVMRPAFGAGVRRMLFEPDAPALWELTRKRLLSTLAEALEGEVDPRTLDVQVSGDGGDAGGEQMRIVVAYRLAAIGEREEQHFDIGGPDGGHG